MGDIINFSDHYDQYKNWIEVDFDPDIFDADDICNWLIDNQIWDSFLFIDGRILFKQQSDVDKFLDADLPEYSSG